MTELSRREIRNLRIVIRHALGIRSSANAVAIVFQSTPTALTIRATKGEAAVEYRKTDENHPTRFAVPMELFDACQASNDDVVNITCQDGNVCAEWRDKDVPQLVQYDELEMPGEFPTVPENIAENPAEFLGALADACSVTDPEPTRYALSCVQLDGDNGRIAASDGHQIFVQTGFEFPWEGAVLLPASKLFGCPHLPTDKPVSIGRTNEWLAMRVGPWTFHFRLNVDGRFPRVEDCIPSDTAATSTLEITKADAKFLLDNVKRLPAADDWNRPVTLDLNGAVVVRAQGDADQPVTELALANSTRAGEAVRINTNRDLLARAVSLGFHQIRFIAADQPAFSRDGDRIFVWALLDPDGAIPSAKNTNRIESPQPSASRVVTRATSTARRTTQPMSEQNTKGNGHKRTTSTSVSEAEPGSLIEQAEALRDSLKDALQKTRELVSALKRQKKQSRIVESTLASLRQLQSVDL